MMTLLKIAVAQTARRGTRLGTIRPSITIDFSDCPALPNIARHGCCQIRDRCVKPFGQPSNLPWNFYGGECPAIPAGYGYRPRKRSVINGLYTVQRFYRKAAHERVR